MTIGETTIATPSDAPAPNYPNGPRLWVNGSFQLRWIDTQQRTTNVKIEQPFALVGRSESADLIIDDPEISQRHVYLHLDHRGVFAVDLDSRTGTQIDNASGSRSAWLTEPGDGVTLVGHRIELIDFQVHSSSDESPVFLELIPEEDPDCPLQPTGRLIFLGRSHHSTLKFSGQEVARIHAILVRSHLGVFLVDLVGVNLAINGHLVRSTVTPIIDGQILTIGHHRLRIRIRPPANTLTSYNTSEGLPEVPINELVPAAPPEVQAALASWVGQAVQAGQSELARQQQQFQKSLLSAVKQLYSDQEALFEKHLERIDRLQTELRTLRSELRRRLEGDDETLAEIPAFNQKTAPDLPMLNEPEFPPLHAPRAKPSDKEGRSTTWLINRVQELETEVDKETRSTWRDLLDRVRRTDRNPR